MSDQPESITSEPLKSKKNSWIGKAGLWVLMILSFGTVVYKSDPEMLAQAFDPGPLPLLLALVVIFALQADMSLRWGAILNPALKKKVPFKELFYIFTYSRVVSQALTPAVGLLLFRPILLNRRRGVEVKDGAASVVIEKLLDLVGIGFFCLPALAVNAGMLTPEKGVLFFGLACITMLVVFAFLGRHLYAVLWGGYQWLVAKVGALIKKYRDQAKGGERSPVEPGRGTVVLLGGLTVGRFLLNPLFFYASAVALNLDIPYWVFLIGFPLVQIPLALSITPGEAGTLQLTWFGILLLAGVKSSEAALFVVAFSFYWVLGLCLVLAVSWLFLKLWPEAE
nr:lysylphosphatidylglycerol synthase transmembrane domain-containing protein [uncultured Pseudodesulfovibrio sp.]